MEHNTGFILKNICQTLFDFVFLNLITRAPINIKHDYLSKKKKNIKHDS